MSYYELWTILGKWRREFTSGEFERTFPSPDSRKVLHDMAKKGLLERLEYGRYKVKTIDDYVKTKNNVMGAYDLLKKCELSYTLTDIDAVFAWTKGGYNVGRFFGFYPVHIKVREADLRSWKRFLKINGKKSFLVDTTPKETLFGIFYILHPVKKMESEMVWGLEAETLARTVEFCKKNIYSYEPALEMLKKEYKLKSAAAQTKVSHSNPPKL